MLKKIPKPKSVLSACPVRRGGQADKPCVLPGAVSIYPKMFPVPKEFALSAQRKFSKFHLWERNKKRNSTSLLISLQTPLKTLLRVIVFKQ